MWSSSRRLLRWCSAPARGRTRIARELGIGQTCLSRWLRSAQARPGADNVFATPEELRRLRKEVKRLQMERDSLKKATAFVATAST